VAYLWSSASGAGAAQGATTAVVSGLGAGAYTVIASDSIGQADTSSFALTAPTAISVSLFSPSYNGFQVRCAGGADGQITATVSGGVAPYSYQWNTGDSVPTVGGLQAGSYQVIVMGANGCTDTSSIILLDAPVLSTTVTSGSGIACHGGTTGLDLSVADGVPPYIYNWSNGAITQDVATASAGNYSVRVEDANGCVRFDSVSVSQPDPLTFSGSLYQYPNGQYFSCDTCHDAQGTLSVSGGSAPYTYLWSDGQTSSSAAGLAQGGSYWFTITDMNGCARTDSFTLGYWQQNPPFDVVASFSTYPGGYNVSCTGCADGEIKLTPVGGVAPFAYTWMHGPTTNEVNGLMAGYYEVTVTDANGTTLTRGYSLSAPQSGMMVQMIASYNACKQEGGIQAMVLGGTPPYSYTWFGQYGEIYGQNWQYLSVNEVGSYMVNVTDANGSTATGTAQVQGGQVLQVQAYAPTQYGDAHASCTEPDGSIVIQLTGGTPPYDITLDGYTDRVELFGGGGDNNFYLHLATSDTLITIDSLYAGNYNLKVNGSGGCAEQQQWLELTHPDELRLTVVPQQLPNGYSFSCDTCADGSAEAVGLSGQAPYSYMWMQIPDEVVGLKLKGASLIGSPELFVFRDLDGVPPTLSTDATLTNMAPETPYAVIMTDALGCPGFAALTLEAAKEAAETQPAWRLGGNTGQDNWLGTNDSTDLLMKVNNQPQLRLGADGVMEVLGQLKASGLEEADTTWMASAKALVIGPNGSMKRIGFSDIPRLPEEHPCIRYMNADGTTNYVPTWVNGPGKIWTSDPCPANVGIGTDDPVAKLDVRGLTYSNVISVNTYDQAAKLTIKGGQPGSQGQLKALEVQDTDGAPTLQVYNNGKTVVGSGHFNTGGDRASIYLGNGTDHYVSAIHGKGLSLSTFGAVDALVVQQSTGKVGIGVGADHVFGDGMLEVDGTIRARRVVAEQTNWPDYVFEKEHALMNLSDLRIYIAEHGHLPEVPSAEEVETNGLDLGELVKLQMQKIEELTLYILELEERLNGKSDK
jgi:hypothetical protein